MVADCLKSSFFKGGACNQAEDLNPSLRRRSTPFTKGRIKTYARVAQLARALD